MVLQFKQFNMFNFTICLCLWLSLLLQAIFSQLAQQCVKELEDGFNDFEREIIAGHQKKLIKWAELAFGIKNKSFDVADLHKCSFDILSHADYLNNIIDNEETAEEIQHELEACEEEKYVEIKHNEDDDDDIDVIIGSADNNHGKQATYCLLDSLFDRVSLFMDQSTKIYNNKPKIYKKYVKKGRNWKWTENNLLMYLMHLLQNGERFTSKHMIMILKILNNVEVWQRNDFFKTVPECLVELLLNSPLFDENNVVLGLWLDDPIKDDNRVDPLSGKSKATKEKYLPHYICKKNIIDDVKLQAKNANKQQYILNGVKRKQENVRITQSILSDLNLVDKVNYQHVSHLEHIRSIIPIIWTYDQYAMVYNFLLPNWPIVTYTGGVLQRFDKITKEKETIYVKCIIKNGGVEVDNCSFKPKYTKVNPMRVDRHTVVELDDDNKVSFNQFDQICANDGSLYPLVILEGVILQQDESNDYYAIFASKGNPQQLVRWSVSSRYDKYHYIDFHLNIDNGNQVNYAVKRKDYPGQVETINWKYIKINDNMFTIQEMFEWVYDYVDPFIGVSSRLGDYPYIQSKIFAWWMDDYNHHDTSNFHESVTVFSYRFLDEPNNRPNVWALTYGHCGMSTMVQAIEQEMLYYLVTGCVVQVYDSGLFLCCDW